MYILDLTLILFIRQKKRVMINFITTPLLNTHIKFKSILIPKRFYSAGVSVFTPSAGTLEVTIGPSVVKFLYITAVHPNEATI